MYIDVPPSLIFFFSMKNWPKVQHLALESIVPVWADFKSRLFWILDFFFHGPPVWNNFSNGQTFLVWCRRVESIFNEDNFYLRFIIVCVQHLEDPPLYQLFLLDVFVCLKNQVSPFQTIELLFFFSSNFRSKLTAPIIWSQGRENGTAKRKNKKKCYA